MIIIDKTKEIIASGTKATIALIIITIAFAINVWSWSYMFSDNTIFTVCCGGFMIIVNAGIKFDKSNIPTSFNLFWLIVGIFCLFSGIYVATNKYLSQSQISNTIDNHEIYDIERMYIVHSQKVTNKYT